MRKLILPLLFLLCAITNVNAQTFLDNLQKSKQGEGKVTVTQSKDIDGLVDGLKVQKPATATPKGNNGKNFGDNHKPTAKPNSAKEAMNKQREHVVAKEAHAATKERDREHNREDALERKAEKRRTEKPTEESQEATAPVVDMSKKIMLHSHKVSGYRVQAFAGGNTRKDKQRAQQIGSAIKMKYPDQPVYVHFYSPLWICRVGNYRSYGEAQKMLKSIRAMGYKAATIVKGMITVQY